MISYQRLHFIITVCLMYSTYIVIKILVRLTRLQLTHWRRLDIVTEAAIVSIDRIHADKKETKQNKKKK